jgi:ABC-2 type transport system permease protein
MNSSKDSTLTGAGALAKLAARRDRIMLAAWVYALAGLVAASVYAFKKAYPTAVKREQFLLAASHNPAVLSLYGPSFGDSVGSMVAWRVSAVGALLAGLMSIFIVVRHTRADEEAGRLELVGSAAVGRHAALAAAVGVSVGANVVIGVVMTVAAIALGLPAAGSVILAAGIVGSGLAFTAVAAVTAQVAQTARSARGLAIAVLGATYLLRAVGDSVTTGPRWLTWLSPMGWAELTRAFGQRGVLTLCLGGGDISGPTPLPLCPADQSPRPLVLVLPVVVGVLVAAVAAVLAVRRDYGAGLLAQRAGADRGAPSLRSPLALAWRLQRSPLIAWLSGALVYGFVIGSAAKGIGGLLNSAQFRKMVLKMGGQAVHSHLSLQVRLTDAYLAAILGFAGLAVTGYAIATVLRLRAEETEQRADPVLATGAGRVSWGLSHVLIAFGGTVAILVLTGAGAGLGLAARSGAGALGAGSTRGGEIVTLTGAALAQAPAAGVLAGLAVALFGLAPTASVQASWSVLGAAVLVLILGATLGLSHWALDVSPFTHAPRLPGGAVSAAPLVWLSAIAVALAIAGLAGLRHRDIANSG